MWLLTAVKAGHFPEENPSSCSMKKELCEAAPLLSGLFKPKIWIHIEPGFKISLRFGGRGEVYIGRGKES